MPEMKRFESRVAPLPLENIDTDQIIPASYLKVTDKAGLGQGLFAHWRCDENGDPKPDFVLNQEAYQGAQILLAGENFGCGSSREHAPWALLDYGFRAVLSPRFADIFRNNSLKNGLLVVGIPHETYEELLNRVQADPSLTLTIDLEQQEITVSEGEKLSFTIDPFARHCLLNGVDQLGYLLAQERDIEAYEEAHGPRVNTLEAAVPRVQGGV